MQKPIIVAVDDQPAILHTVASALSELYRVRPFSSGQTALKYLENQPADLILLDYDMPEMNGCEGLERLHHPHHCLGFDAQSGKGLRTYAAGGGGYYKILQAS